LTQPQKKIRNRQESGKAIIYQTRNGQIMITIPKLYANSINLVKGDVIEFEPGSNYLVLKKVKKVNKFKP
jgi:hypothetical protein